MRALGRDAGKARTKKLGRNISMRGNPCHIRCQASNVANHISPLAVGFVIGGLTCV